MLCKKTCLVYLCLRTPNDLICDPVFPQPPLIERLLPVQKLSAESYKEQEGRQSKTLTAGQLLERTQASDSGQSLRIGVYLLLNPARDLEIFEKLMAMDDESFTVRWKRSFKPKDILAEVAISRITDYFEVDPDGILPVSSPVDWSPPEYDNVKLNWRSEDIAARAPPLGSSASTQCSLQRLGKSGQPP